MAGEWRKEYERERRLFWKRRIQLSKHFVERAFPSEFFCSLWDEWIERIKAGQQREVERLEKLAEEYKGFEPHPDDPPWDPMEDLSEDYHESVRVSQSMYAALVVALWAEVERLLKDHVGFARYALQEFGIVPSESEKKIRKQFDADPYDKKGISDWLREFTALDISALPRHPEIDAVRILNNSFKHSESKYKPEEGKPWTQIESSVLASLACIGPEGKIDYSEVPFEQLVSACRDYCTALSDELVQALERLQPADFLEDQENG